MSDKKHKNEPESNVEEFEFTGENNAEDFELADAEKNSSNKLKDLRTKLKACEQEKMQHLEQLQSTKAEFLNARKRLEDEKFEAKERTIDKAAEQLLPLYDSFTLAMADEAAWAAIDANWRKGVEAIYSQLKAILQSYQVTELNPKGALFDPLHHEAMGYEDVTDEAAHDTIVKVLQVGFERKNGDLVRALRPARVIIGNYTNA